MKAVIISDDLAFTVSAASTLSRVGRQIGVNVKWTTIFWPINALNERALAEKALTEALDAQLILFPARCAQSLPRWVFDWLNRWALRRIARDAAIGIMNDGHTAEPGKPLPAELFLFARAHGLSLLVNEQARLASSVEILDCCQRNPQAKFPLTQTGWRGFISPPSYRGFGINE